MLWFFSILFTLLVAVPGFAQVCDLSFDSTFEMVQELIFERHGCTASACHSGANPSGGLDLSKEVAWDNLFGVPPVSVHRGSLLRVAPGNKQNSLLWLNLASSLFPDRWQAPLRPMPLGGAAPLSLAELELLRLWIENGAVREGIVPQTVSLFDDVCLPPLEPLEIEPLPAPPPGEGVQLRAPRVDLPANFETEVCFASYYDFSDVVPRSSLTEDGKFFFARWGEERADPLTHHYNVKAYQGATSIDDPIWGAFTCKHGPRKGESCDPVDANSCGEPGGCGSEPVAAPGCIGYGPEDTVFGNNTAFTLGETRRTAEGDTVLLIPLKGIAIWNSHSFNITPVPGKVDRWFNFGFATARPMSALRTTIPIITAESIWDGGAPAYSLREACAGFVMPEGAALEMLTFHTHKRGIRWVTFWGEFKCRGGANAGSYCSPFRDPNLPDICRGAPCTAYDSARAGDCDGDNLVSIAELTTSVRIVLGLTELAACPRIDSDGNGTATIVEIVAAVGSALRPVQLDPVDAMVYLAYDYADPLFMPYEPPVVLGYPGSSAADRTLTYCAIYDNGFSDPDAVVRNSQRPTNALPCEPTHCAEGLVGAPCSAGDDTICDSFPGAGDGFCDACANPPGATTDDEMFVLLGSYVAPPVR